MFSRINYCFLLVLVTGIGFGVSKAHAQQTLFDIPAPQYVIAQAKTDAEIAADIRASQKLLAKLGYYSGSATGKESAALTKAVKAYQKDRKLVVSGKANGILVRSLESALKKAEVHEKRVLVVEQMLKKLDYSPGRVDGKEDSSLTKAIKAFQKDRNSKAKKKGLVNGITIRSLRTAMEAKGLTPPRDAYSLSNLEGKTNSGTKKKKKSTSSKKTSSASKSTKSKSKSTKSAEKQGSCKKGQVQIGEKCLKACKTGYTRDKKSNRCKKDKETSKSSSKSKTTTKKSKTSSKSSNDCKKGTEKVGEKCLKVCKTGYTRDKKSNRCKKDKASITTKSSSSKSKACKSGTENVDGRCLKKCKTGYKRDSKTNRCKKK